MNGLDELLRQGPARILATLAATFVVAGLLGCDFAPDERRQASPGAFGIDDGSGLNGGPPPASSAPPAPAAMPESQGEAPPAASATPALALSDVEESLFGYRLRLLQGTAANPAIPSPSGPGQQRILIGPADAATRWSYLFSVIPNGGEFAGQNDPRLSPMLETQATAIRLLVPDAAFEPVAEFTLGDFVPARFNFNGTAADAQPAQGVVVFAGDPNNLVLINFAAVGPDAAAACAAFDESLATFTRDAGADVAAAPVTEEPLPADPAAPAEPTAPAGEEGKGPSLRGPTFSGRGRAGLGMQLGEAHLEPGAAPSGDSTAPADAIPSPDASAPGYNPDAAATAAGVELPASTDPDYHAKLVELVVGDSPEGSMAAIAALIEIQPDQVDGEVRKQIARALRTATFDKTPVPSGAYRALAHWGGKFSVPLFLELLEKHPDDADTELFEALGPLQDVRAAKPVAERLGTADHEDAVLCLTAMGPAAEKALIDAAPSDNAQVCETAIRLLGEVGTRQSLGVLKKAQRAQNETIKQAAEEATEKIKSRTAM